MGTTGNWNGGSPARPAHELAERLVNEGKIGRGISLAINGDVVSTGLITKVPEGAEIAIVPQISGG